MSGQVKNLSDQDLRILAHYATGTALSAIASMVSLDVEDVREVVGEVAGFERKKAADIVQQHDRRRRAQAAPVPTPPIKKPVPPVAAPVPAVDSFINPEAMPAEPVSIVTALPAAPEPKPMAAAVTAVMERLGLPAAPEPAPAPVTMLADLPDVDVDAVLDRATAAGGRYAKQAGKIREQVVALDIELVEWQRVADAEKRVEQARAQLAAATEELRAAKGRPGSPSPVPAPQRGDASTRVIRAWAQAQGIEVNPLGVLPRHIVDQYLAAQDVA